MIQKFSCNQEGKGTAGLLILSYTHSIFSIIQLAYQSLIGFKTPAEAIEGSYVDKKCPFTSDVSIRGRILK
jgi:hypothetical protein